MIRVEMEAVEIGFSAAIDDFTPERTGETGLVIDPAPMAGEIRDHELRLADLAQQAIADVLVMFEFLHSCEARSIRSPARPPA